MLGSNRLLGNRIPETHSGTAVNDLFRNMAPTMTAPSSVASFEAALINPGYISTPYISDSGVTPLSYGTAVATRTGVAQNDNYLAMFIAPSSVSSFTSSGLSTLAAGFNIVQYSSSGFSTIPVTTVDIIGSAGSWASSFGTTLAADYLFPWAGQLDVVLNIPEAVLAGNYFIGNAPVQQVIGCTLSQLIPLSSEIKADSAGMVYNVRSSIVERKLNGQQYPLTTIQGTPFSERVSWLIFAPGTAGSISGTPTTQWNYTTVARVNYSWISFFSPLISPMLESLAKSSTMVDLSAEEKSRLGDVVPRLACIPTIPNPEAMLRNLHHVSPIPMPTSDEQIETESAPFRLTNACDSQKADLEYTTHLLSRKWGNWDTYPPGVSAIMAEFFDNSYRLIEAFDEVSQLINEFSKDVSYAPVSCERGRSFRGLQTSKGLTYWLNRLDAIGKPIVVSEFSDSRSTSRPTRR